jgi:hypothetical protein
MEPWMLTNGVLLSATAAGRGLIWRCTRARNERRSTDVYLEWMVAEAEPLPMTRRPPAGAALVAPPRHWAIPSDDHTVQLYEYDAEIVMSIADFYEPALAAGDPIVLVATPAHRLAVEATLAGRGHDLGKARYVALDAAETLDRFLVDGSVDSALFDRTVGDMVRELVLEGRPVRIYGEMVGILWGAGDVAGAMRLETLWNELRGQVPFALHCGYGVTTRDDRPGLEALCRLHGATLHPPQDSAIAA